MALAVTPAQIAPHQAEVTSVTFLGIAQGATGDWTAEYQAPDGEVAGVRIACGAYARSIGVTPPDQAAQMAIGMFNTMRAGRARRIQNGQPVTCRLSPSTNLRSLSHAWPEPLPQG